MATTTKPPTAKQLMNRIARLKDREAKHKEAASLLGSERKEMEGQLKGLKAAGKASKPVTNRNGDED